MILASCTPSRFVKPLKEKEKSIGMALGGPLFKFGEDEANGKSGLVIPVPFAALTAGHGVKKGLTGFASFHLTSLAYENVHLELGAVKQLYSSSDSTFGVTASPQLNFIYGTSAGKVKVWPQLDLNAYWHYNKKKEHFAYIGMSNWFEFAGKKAHDESQKNHWIPNFQIGHQFSGKKMDYFIEIKCLAPLESNQNIVMDYWKPFNNKKGATGAYIGLRKKF